MKTSIFGHTATRPHGHTANSSSLSLVRFQQKCKTLFMCLSFFVISTGLQAFPDWSVSLSINGDACDGHTLNVYSNFATVQPNSRAIENSPTYSQSQFNPFNATFYPNNNDNHLHINNLDELYKIELVLRSPNCPVASLMSYFTVPTSLANMRYGQTPNTGDLDANWHTQTSGYNAVNLHIAELYDAPENNGVFKAKVIAMDGRTVFQSVDVTTGTNNIELPSVSKGVYIIQAFDKNDQLIYNGKIQL